MIPSSLLPRPKPPCHPWIPPAANKDNCTALHPCASLVCMPTEGCITVGSILVARQGALGTLPAPARLKVPPSAPPAPNLSLPQGCWWLHQKLLEWGADHHHTPGGQRRHCNRGERDSRVLSCESVVVPMSAMRDMSKVGVCAYVGYEEYVEGRWLRGPGVKKSA